MKLLFTSVGRRVELMQAFKRAAQKNNMNLTIYGADMSETAPALLFCDRAVMVPRIKDDKYIPSLLKVCEEEKIDALIPTIDTDLQILSESKELFANVGTRVIISQSDRIALCRDKRRTAEFFWSVGLKSPRAIDDVEKYADGFPAFIKPKDGSSSVFAYKVNNAAELATYAKQVPEYIIQNFVEGTEYTVDVFCDFYGNPIYITPRIRLAVRAGEVLKTEIVQDTKIIEEIRRLIAVYKPCGAITVQLIHETKSEENYYIEINPRFGGGAPLSMMAGADSALALMKLINGESVSYVENAAENGAVFSRFDQCVRVK